MRKISFKIPICPQAQMRSRHFSKKTKTGRAISGTYKASEQKRYEDMLIPLLVQHKPNKPLSGAIEMVIVANLPIPQSKSAWWHKALFHDKIFHIRRPDIDNLLKNILDCMEKIGFFHNDSQIYSIHFFKRYHEIPCWFVSLTEIQVPKTKKEFMVMEEKGKEESLKWLNGISEI